MDLTAHLLSAGWASGVNAYLTVAMLSVLGRAGAVEVPEPLTSDGVLIVSVTMSMIEFVADKIPYLDNTWDVIHTLIRPAIGSVLGVEFAGQEGLDSLDEALAGGTSGSVALASHAVKASLRLGINASPEPVSNILASLTEDGLVAAVTAFSLEQPELAAAIAILLLVAGIALVILVWTRIRRAWRAMRERWHRSPPR
jgi:Domain of unknown function (DUF4126)